LIKDWELASFLARYIRFFFFTFFDWTSLLSRSCSQLPTVAMLAAFAWPCCRVFCVQHLEGVAKRSATFQSKSFEEKMVASRGWRSRGNCGGREEVYYGS
jgi:hypothetical protein